MAGHLPKVVMLLQIPIQDHMGLRPQTLLRRLTPIDDHCVSHDEGGRVRTQPNDGSSSLIEHNCINLRLPSHGGLYAWEFEKEGRESTAFALLVDALRHRDRAPVLLRAMLPSSSEVRWYVGGWL
jgi:hypothetical protein